jgi:hypothetical protein
MTRPRGARHPLCVPTPPSEPPSQQHIARWLPHGPGQGGVLLADAHHMFRVADAPKGPPRLLSLSDTLELPTPRPSPPLSGETSGQVRGSLPQRVPQGQASMGEQRAEPPGGEMPPPKLGVPCDTQQATSRAYDVCIMREHTCVRICMLARACACMCVHAHACCSSTHTWDANGAAGVFWSGDQAQPDDVDGDHPSEASDGDSSPCTHAIMRHESCTHNRQSVLQIGTQSTAIHPSVPASTELRNEVRGCESATKISAGPHRGAATCLKALRTVPQNSVFPKGSTQWCGSVRPGCSLRPRTREWLLLSAQWRPCAFVQGQGVQYGGVHGVLAYGQCCSRHRMPSWRTLYMQSRRAHDSTMSRSRTGSSM